MAKIRSEGKGEVEVKVGEDGVIILREPTNKEWNEFTQKRFPFSRNSKVKDNGNEARSELFDKVFTSISNIEDEAGEVTELTAKERIPMRMKAEIIFKAFESDEVVEIKNS